MKNINIALSASKEYSPFAKIMMASLIKNHPNYNINFYFFYLDQTIISLKKDFIKIVKESNSENNIEFIKIDYKQIEIVDNKKGWAIDLWCRWYLLDYLKNSCDRVLILGVDTMIQHDISDFYFQNLDEYYFACCPDMHISNSNPDKWPAIHNDMQKMNLKDKSKYINGDVVLINLNETKKDLSFIKFLKLYQKHQFTCWDQDTITYCFNEKIKFQDYLYYNYFPNLNIKNHDDNLLIKKAKIIHFAGGPKPWRVPICEANNYTRIKEWYNYADSLGITSNWDYIKCYSQLPFRKIWRNIKKVLKYLLKW
jgi:lipopolysaccharide biosynthesis glycosyltransferase